MKLIGYQHKHLTFQDGRSTDGYFLYLSEERKGVEGVATERVFLTDAKANGYKPYLGDELRLFYNRYGKLDSVEVLS